MQNRTLKETMNVMLLSLGLPDNKWGKLIYLLAMFLIEYPHKKLDQTLYKL